MYRLYLLILSLNLPCILNAQQTLSFLNKEDITEIAYLKLKPLGEDIYNAAITGEIRVYSDIKFKNKLTIDEVKKIGGITETVNILLNPDDPYELTETTIYSPFDVSGIRNIWFYGQIHKNNLKGINAGAISRTEIIINGRDTSFADSLMFYFKLEDVAKFITPHQHLLLNYFSRFAGNAHSFAIGRQIISDILISKTEELKSVLLNKANYDEPKIFTLSNLTKALTSQEKNELLTECHTVVFQVDSNDYYNTVDSVFCKDVQLNDIMGFCIMDSWHIDDNIKKRSSVTHIGLTYSFQHYEINFGEQPLFFITDQQFYKLLLPEEIAFWKFIFNYSAIYHLNYRHFFPHPPYEAIIEK